MLVLKDQLLLYSESLICALGIDQQNGPKSNEFNLLPSTTIHSAVLTRHLRLRRRLSKQHGFWERFERRRKYSWRLQAPHCSKIQLQESGLTKLTSLKSCIA